MMAIRLERNTKIKWLEDHHMYLSPKSHLHNIYTNNLRKAAQNIFADGQDAKKEAIPTSERW